jgi:hypothetical protein
MHKPKDITSIEDDSTDIILLVFTQWEKGPYEPNINAHVLGLAYLLQPLKDATNDLYVFDIC